jgi:CRISPR-associated protein Cmr6
MVTEGRPILGLGIESVLETGLRLHATYGTPLIPGSSLKGLSSHYCAEEWGRTGQRYCDGGEWHDILFGTG